MQISRISKIAGLSIVGFCVTAAVADKVNLNPATSQVAGFVGAMIGTVVGGLRRRTWRRPGADQPPPGPAGESGERRE